MVIIPAILKYVQMLDSFLGVQVKNSVIYILNQVKWPDLFPQLMTFGPSTLPRYLY